MLPSREAQKIPNNEIENRYLLCWDRWRLDLNARTHVMGVVNVTPDSFSDGGLFYTVDDAIAQGKKLVAEGADILDVGGESTRPFSEGITAEEEIRRVVPVVRELAARTKVPVSIDTTKAAVARAAIMAGAAMINDISGLRSDAAMAATAAEFGVPLILMHMRGTPKNMQVAPEYEDVVGEVIAFLSDVIGHAVANGVARDLIIVDPGIGFGKTFDHNLLLLNRLSQFGILGAPVLVGSSRKAFIRNILKQPHEEDLTPRLPIVETGTQATVSAAALNGAHIVRVHDVGQTVATVKVIDAIKRAASG